MTPGSRSGGPRDDDEALGWAGDDDPTLQTRSTDADAREHPPASDDLPPAVLPVGFTVKGPAAAVEADAARRAAETAPLSSAALLALGVFAGVYLLYTVGWFIGASRIDNPLTDPLSRFMFDLGRWLAVAAPVLWFAVVFWLTGGGRTRRRLAWLLLGAVLLVPLPILVSGVAV